MKKILPHMYKNYKSAWGDESEMLISERKRIESKPILRKLWWSWYEEIAPYMSAEGFNVEVGSGGGFAGQYFNNIFQTDVIQTPYIQMCFDASNFPFKDETIDNILMIAVLHHLKKIEAFFDEARRVLKSHGKILMVEPYVSFISYPIWKLLHYEGCNLGSLSINSNQYARIDANIAIPTILFKKKRKQFLKKYPDLEIAYETYHTVLHFFASGGYSYPSPVPKAFVPNFLKIERMFRSLGKWLGSWMTIIIQKT